MKFTNILQRGQEFWRNASSYGQQLTEPVIRLGVTGLSRSGKTVFITSMVHSILNGARLPFFTVQSLGKLQRAYLEPQPDDDLPRFAYETHLETLTGTPPRWPGGTRRISQLRLTLEYDPGSVLKRQFGHDRLHIDIIDYPGEWLLDLPLLHMSYEDWSQQAWGLSEQPERRELAARWHKMMADIDPDAPQDEQQVSAASDEFKAYLQSCRKDAWSLSTIPPGRFLLPGDMEGSPMLTFVPLKLEPEARPQPGSMHAMMARRYQSYQNKVIKPFFHNYFLRIDRQLVLVDVLGTLNAGPAALQDLKQALSGILSCFRTGANSWLSSVFQPRIEKIAFAATKADHLHQTSHDRLEAILTALVQDAMERADYAGADVKSFALASIRATSETIRHYGGEKLPCIQGTPQQGERLGGKVFDGSQSVAIFPGDLPDDPAELLSPAQAALNSADHEELIRIIRFSPPPLKINPATGVGTYPNIRLDRVLQFLLGDRLS